MKLIPFIILLVLLVIAISYFMGMVMIHIINKKINNNNNKFIEQFKSKKHKYSYKKEKNSHKKKKSKNSKNIKSKTLDKLKDGFSFNLKIPIDKIVIEKAKELLKNKYGVDSKKLDKDGNLKKYKNYYQKFTESKTRDDDEKFEVKGYNITEYLR